LTHCGRTRPSAVVQPNQVASVFSAAGRFISAASLGQRELSRGCIARALENVRDIGASLRHLPYTHPFTIDRRDHEVSI
jgi:hypothetical protein